jgi:hypothetical protein
MQDLPHDRGSYRVAEIHEFTLHAPVPCAVPQLAHWLFAGVPAIVRRLSGAR